MCGNDAREAGALANGGAVLLTRCGSGIRRWVTTAVWAPGLTGVSLLAHPARPVLAGFPWLVIACVYSAFDGWSYHDLITTGPSWRRHSGRPWGPPSYG